ncbi:MAG: DNA-3-methyladenine glycosylase family protein [Solirubrobacterales bacterium]
MPPARRTVPAKPKAASIPSQRKAIAHLRDADPVLAALIEDFGPRGLDDGRDGSPHDHYGTLVRAIVGQQLSTKAAASIFARLTERYGGRTPTPEEVLAADPEELRLAAGLSRPKVGYLRSLAEHVLSGELELERLDELDDEAVTAELVAVKGLGVWTAHMFLMFQLERPDVLPVGDLGIRRAIERAYGLKSLPDASAMEKIAQPWRPYRTLACRYLWRSLRNAPM